MVFNNNPDFYLFRQPITYATFLRDELEQIRAMQGFETLRFYSVKAQGGYDSVLAVGCDAGDQVLLPTFAPILLDNAPCPPECHYQNTANAPATPNVWLTLDAARQVQQAMPSGNRFAASFPMAEIEELLSDTDAVKFRVYYALLLWLPSFLVCRVGSDGNNLPDYYLLDDGPVSSAVL